MSNVVSIKQAALKAPQTIEQVVAAVAEIGRHQRERARLETEMNDALAIIRQKFEEQAQPMAEQIRVLSHGVQAWCEAHRKEITENGKTKTVTLPSGEVKWRKSPPKVNIRSTKDVLAYFKKWGMEEFIRTKEEINKEAILAKREAVAGIKGVSVSDSEDFVIVPFETKLEEVA